MGTATDTAATTGTSPSRLDRLLPLLLGGASTILYLALPHGGRHGWDALMTGSVLARPAWASTRDWLFFAHPLVIPATAPFAWLGLDPLRAAAAREALFGGVVVALAFAAVRAVTGRRAAALVAAAGLLLAVSRWRLATLGEEKEIALAFGGAFFLFYLDHRGLLDLGVARWRALAPRVRRLVLGALLAVSCAVHLVNGVLVVVVIADALLDRRAARDAATVLAAAAALGAPFFLWLAIGPGGARSPLAVARVFLEYHLSGEFVTVPDSVGARVGDAWLGARRWLVGDLPAPWPIAETVLAGLAGAALLALAFRASRPLAARAAVWLGLLALHFFFYEPWDPEAWAPAALAWLLVAALALGRRLVWLAPLLAALAVAGGVSFARAHAALDPVATTRRLDAILPPDAVVLTHDRLVASYFHIYTRRAPVIVSYLGLSDRQLVDEQLFSSLSLAYYRPRLSVEEVSAACREGRCVTVDF